ncbi:MAG: class I poly(R)-hydroxyalkanoic acid synthase [Alphaproteobacteria bacterium CG11_big_fil_rev_8_21_14_0_20_39_49]|nr:MAG: class I poly(R)-hydroxyalkanoic acid synthase [Alphaproteobacteria bacterium CG11_big_fil_rev_8_21_14_0_20_39_49]
MAKNKDEYNFENYIDNFAKVVELYGVSLQKAIENSEGNNNSPTAFQTMPKVWQELMAKLMEDPDKLYEKQLDLCADYMKIWGNAWNRYIGHDEQPLYPADPKDKRFKDETWNRDLTFDFIKQSYILTNKWLHDIVSDIKGVDKKTLEKFDFYTRQFADAMCPSNFAFTNPLVIRETIETKGENLKKGLENLINDLEKSKNFLNISTAKKDAFKIGENIACTKGKVVYKNDLIELIQYEPTCKKVYKTPLLIIPAWINKYYILDLSPETSFVKWIVDQGYTVFMISWVNPTKKLAHKKFEDYMLEGPLAAIDSIEKATGEKQVNVMAYCLGGTLLACTLAYLKSKKQTPIKSATFLTTMVDFGDVGDMSVFIDEQQIDAIEEQMRQNGFLDGSEISAMFSSIRANDLIWSFVVNNYLLGRDPMPFDILYWNADSTRMPADTHSFYLRNMYLKNKLKKPNALKLDGVPIDVTKIDTPTYLLATQEDHIAPWKTCYESVNLFSGENNFVLAGSGHVAGVVNHPDKNKYGYYVNAKNDKDPQKWLDGAKQHSGSWWTNWDKWNSSYSGQKIDAVKPGSGKLKTIEDAPGSYIKINSI